MLVTTILNNKTILVVEDEQNLLEAIERKLKKENVNVLTAKTGEEALAALEKQKPDLVWLDIFTVRNQRHRSSEKYQKQSVAERFESGSGQRFRRRR